MTVLSLTLIIFLGAFCAGLIGSLTGLGGGVVIIPLLSVVLGIDIHYAIGAALVSVIAVSSGSAAAYIREGITNMRLGMFLEIATTLGAVTGAFIAGFAPTHIIAILFGIVLLFSAINSFKKRQERVETDSSTWAKKLKLPSAYPSPNGKTEYGIKNIAGGFSIMMLAGILSGLLGIGSGALKVIAMDNVMKVPFKVSTTTSNFMMGVTAVASAIVYLQRGYIEPGLCMPVVIGVLLGAILGSRILVRANSTKLRYFFSIVIILLALSMLYNGIAGKV
jgi:uncharacterized membrane protein YfcA